MPANVEGMVREGVNAYRDGRKQEARALLLRAVEIDQYNEQAWLWLSAVVDTVEEQRTCLENVLAINPNNERAKQGIDLLIKKSGAAPPQAAGPTPSDEDVLASSVFAAADEEAPPSIDWGAPPAPPTATSSSSAYYQVDEPSAQEYDSWVANLGLGAGSESQPPATSAPTSAFASAFVDDEDLFGAEDEGIAIDTPPPPAKAATPPPPAPSHSPEDRRTSPALSSDSLLDELDEDGDDPLVAEFDEDYDEAELGKIDPEEMFSYIPKEIKATRLPGTRERYPIPVLVGLLVVVLLDIGAVVFLISQLSAASGS